MNQAYESWKNNQNLEENLKRELFQMNDHQIEEAFHNYLEFGTGGMRGILGAGINRMNIYTIRRANYGLGTYLLKHSKRAENSVVIAYDNRHMSREFALESAKVLGALGIKCYIFSSLRPTPELSFAVRYLKATSGIVITASHNPKEYNGYKIYDEDGCQYVPEYADVIIDYVDQCQDIFAIEILAEAELLKRGLLSYIDTEIDEAYLKRVKEIQLLPELSKNVKVVFTPLHGTSSLLGSRIIRELGYDLFPVEEQMIHCPDFCNTKSPNPENKEAYERAILLCDKVKADIIIATDPDADRLGVVLPKEGKYLYLTGNQTGAILIDYILSTRLKKGFSNQNGMIFNTIVTSDLGAEIAKKYHVGVKSTLTGFKFIGEQAKLIENTDQKYLFGYEESYGYLISDFVRDKDSIQSIVMILEACNYYKNVEKIDLYDKLNQIYDEYGYYLDGIKNIVLEGIAGSEKIKRIVGHFQTAAIREIAGDKILLKEDYASSKRFNLKNNQSEPIDLPKSNVVKFIFENGNWFVLRPSGTEPKLKIYASFKDRTLELAKEKMNQVFDYVLKEIEKL